MKTRIITLCVIFIAMVSYVIWIFNMSEPEYTDNPGLSSDQVKRYDFVSVTQNGIHETRTGMVIQIDTTTFQNHYALVRMTDTDNPWRLLLNTETPDFSIIGKGTFYHKVNTFIGFNIMMITTIVILIMSFVVLYSLIGLIRQVLGFDPFFE